jgi:hypothetical protein
MSRTRLAKIGAAAFTFIDPAFAAPGGRGAAAA